MPCVCGGYIFSVWKKVYFVCKWRYWWIFFFRLEMRKYTASRTHIAFTAKGLSAGRWLLCSADDMRLGLSGKAVLCSHSSDLLNPSCSSLNILLTQNGEGSRNLNCPRFQVYAYLNSLYRVTCVWLVKSKSHRV